MTGVYSVLGFVAQLKTIERDMEELPKAIVAKACAMIAKQAKAQIGKEHEEWPPLAESTKQDRVHHGYAANKPLLRTAELRDSIEWTVHGHGSHVEGEVGSASRISRRALRRAALTPD
jgi:hypothetical protein